MENKTKCHLLELYDQFSLTYDTLTMLIVEEGISVSPQCLAQSQDG